MYSHGQVQVQSYRQLLIFNQVQNQNQNQVALPEAFSKEMMLNPFFGFDQIEKQLMEFSNMHDMMMGMNPEDAGGFQMVSHCFVQSYGPNGVEEQYFDTNAVAKGMNGHTISERQQGFKGLEEDRFAHEKMLNDQGMKYIKTRNRNGQVETTNNMFNLEQGEQGQFEQRWNDQAKQIGFMGVPQRKQLQGGYNEPQFQLPYQSVQGQGQQQQRYLPYQGIQRQYQQPQQQQYALPASYSRPQQISQQYLRSPQYRK